MCTWSLRMHTWNTQKTAAKHVIRMRTRTTAHGTRCWKCSRCQAPAQRHNKACRIGRYAGWHCRAILSWTFCACPWNVKQGSDCRDAQPHCFYGTICRGIMAVRQEARSLGQYWTKRHTLSKRTQERITASTAEKPRRRVVLCIHVSLRGKTGNDYNTPASLRVRYNT